MPIIIINVIIFSAICRQLEIPSSGGSNHWYLHIRQEQRCEGIQCSDLET
jgi:hypothetical protein